MADSVTIRIEDVSRAGLCAKGARAWFAAHGLDFRAFLKHGLPAETLLALGDAMADRVVQVKKASR